MTTNKEKKIVPIPKTFEEMLNYHLDDHAILLEMIYALAAHLKVYIRPVIDEENDSWTYEVEELLNELGRDHVGKIMAICLDVPIIDARERLIIRLVCIKCNTPATNNKNRCDRCGGELAKRKDDDPQAMENRWNEFKFRTQPVISHLDSLGLSEHIDGARPITEVAEDVEKVIRQRLGL